MERPTNLDAYRQERAKNSSETIAATTVESFFADVATYKDGLFTASLQRTYEDLSTPNVSEKFIVSELLATFNGLVALEEESPNGLTSAQIDQAILPTPQPIDAFDDIQPAVVHELQLRNTAIDILSSTPAPNTADAAVISLAAFRHYRNRR